jgi:hypothetical protein
VSKLYAGVITRYGNSRVWVVSTVSVSTYGPWCPSSSTVVALGHSPSSPVPFPLHLIGPGGRRLDRSTWCVYHTLGLADVCRFRLEASSATWWIHVVSGSSWWRREMVWAAWMALVSLSTLSAYRCTADRLRRQLARPFRLVTSRSWCCSLRTRVVRSAISLAAVVLALVPFPCPRLLSTSTPRRPLVPFASWLVDSSRRLRLDSFELGRLDSTRFDSPSTPRPPLPSRLGALWARWDGARRRLSCPQVFLAIAGCRGRGRPFRDGRRPFRRRRPRRIGSKPNPSPPRAVRSGVLCPGASV